MIVHAAESLYWFNTTEPPYLIKRLPISLESRHTEGSCYALSPRRYVAAGATRAAILVSTGRTIVDSTLDSYYIHVLI